MANNQITYKSMAYTAMVLLILLFIFIFVRWKHAPPPPAPIIDLINIEAPDLIPDDPPIEERLPEFAEIKENINDSEKAGNDNQQKADEEGLEGKSGSSSAASPENYTPENTSNEDVSNPNEGKDDMTKDDLPENEEVKTKPIEPKKFINPNATKQGNPRIKNPNPTPNIPQNNTLSNRPNPKPNNQLPPSPPPPPRPKYTLDGSSGDGRSPNRGSSRGDGFSRGEGDGTGNSGTGPGAGRSGTGSGIANIVGGLNGRGIVGSYRFKDEFSSNAKVRVMVKVDANGNVVAASIYTKGTTTTDNTIRNIALTRARSLKFSSGTDGDSGVIEFNFTVQ